MLRQPVPARKTYPTPTSTEPCKTPIIESALGGGESNVLLKALYANPEFKGIVISSFGAGLSSETYSEIKNQAREKITVLATHTGSGKTLENTYGFEGAEITNRKCGAVLAGLLSPRKARILLWLLLQNQYTQDEVSEDFLKFDERY